MHEITSPDNTEGSDPIEEATSKLKLDLARAICLRASIEQGGVSTCERERKEKIIKVVQKYLEAFYAEEEWIKGNEEEVRELLHDTARDIVSESIQGLTLDLLMSLAMSVNIEVTCSVR